MPLEVKFRSIPLLLLLLGLSETGLTLFLDLSPQLREVGQSAVIYFFNAFEISRPPRTKQWDVITLCWSQKLGCSCRRLVI